MQVQKALTKKGAHGLGNTEVRIITLKGADVRIYFRAGDVSIERCLCVFQLDKMGHGR